MGWSGLGTPGSPWRLITPDIRGDLTPGCRTTLVKSWACILFAPVREDLVAISPRQPKATGQAPSLHHLLTSFTVSPLSRKGKTSLSWRPKCCWLLSTTLFIGNKQSVLTLFLGRDFSIPSPLCLWRKGTLKLACPRSKFCWSAALCKGPSGREKDLLLASPWN